MYNLDNIAIENNKQHNKKWPPILDHPYKIIGSSGLGKTNSSLSLLSQQDNIDKIYL